MRSKIKEFFTLEGFFRSILASFMNVIIYGVLIALIFGFEQGIVMPIHMYHNDWYVVLINLSAFHFFMIFIALLMSWYPVYIFEAVFTNSNNSTSWKMSHWGLIYYLPRNLKTENDNLESANSKNIELDINKQIVKTESKIRKFFGMFVFVLWSWIIAAAYLKSPHLSIVDNEIVSLNSKLLFYGLNGSITIMVFYAFIYLNDIGNKGKQTYEFFASKSFAKYLILSLLIAFFLVVIISILFNWSGILVISQMIFCGLLALLFMVFRNNRANLLPNKKTDQGNNETSIIALLQLMRTFGIATIIFLLAISFFADFASMINPINILMGVLIAFYTVLILPIKLFLYLNSKNDQNKWNSLNILGIKLTSTKYIVGLILLISTSSYFNYSGNDLHMLTTLSYKEKDKIDLGEFHKAYSDTRDSTITPIFYAAYGGGLKANYWNSLILECMDKDTFQKNVVAMSGVSGGGMGIGLYTMGQYQLLSNSSYPSVQSSSIGSANILSTELSWLFGWDYFRERLPNVLLLGKDRSHRSMQYYSKLYSGSDTFVDSLSFYSVYKKLFKDKGYFPNLIVNSTSTKDKYGVVSAINNDTMFSGAMNLLDIRDTTGNRYTLTYLEALSTCNRFPVISPAAMIPNKGHFVDGGYFENSGIMSLISFKKSLESIEKIDSIQKPIFNKKVKLVSVRNDKNNYLQSLLTKELGNLQVYQNNNIYKISNSSEILSILGTAAGLEKMPNYLRNLIGSYFNKEYELVYIDLPYYITHEDIEAYFGGKLSKSQMQRIDKIVTNSNKEILQILGDQDSGYNLREWGVIDPPTARILSRPVEIYMKNMIKMKSVKKSINSVSH